MCRNIILLCSRLHEVAEHDVRIHDGRLVIVVTPGYMDSSVNPLFSLAKIAIGIGAVVVGAAIVAATAGTARES